MRNEILILVTSAACLMGGSLQANPVVEKQLQLYQQQGATLAQPEQGKKLWYAKNGDRSCSSCHGRTIDKAGKHFKTGKLIKPMAPSVNPDRYQDGKKIEKWFLRNCKWTFGRECTVQEKTDTLSWLNSF